MRTMVDFTFKLRTLALFTVCCSLVISFPVAVVKKTSSASQHVHYVVKPDVVEYPITSLPDLSSLANSEFQETQNSCAEDNCEVSEDDFSDPYSDMLSMDASVEEKVIILYREISDIGKININFIHVCYNFFLGLEQGSRCRMEYL
jgi:hypothetical protein